jgi:chromosome segregation protein
VEEAAGILKHRRRKEKTLRKLDAMEANLTRLSDLAGELRRQLKPLGKQAEIAREAATIAAVVRDAKARLFADELVGLRTQLADHARTEQERSAERLVLQDQSEQLKLRIDALEAQQRSEAVDARAAVAFGLERVQERCAVSSRSRASVSLCSRTTARWDRGRHGQPGLDRRGTRGDR